MKELPFPLPLVVRSPNWLGDAIMALPAVYNLRALLGREPLSVASPASLAPLWEACDFVDQVVPLGTRKLLWDRARCLQERRFASAILLTQSERSILEARLAGIRWVYGRSKSWAKPLLTQWLPRSPVSPRRHLSLEYLELVARLGASKEVCLPKLRVAPFPREDQKKWISLCPGAEYGPAKRWPARYFAAVGRALLDTGSATVWILGSTRDAPVCNQVQQLCPNAVNLCGKTRLEEFLRYLASSDLVICNDSGAMHAAAALRIPTLAIFGSTDPVRTGPLNPQAWILKEDVPCSPCFRRRCPIDFPCMEGLSPETVVQYALKILWKSQP
jgi:heptosyltransferase-2